MASMLIVGFDVCDEEGVPLTQRQKVLLTRNALMAWDGFDRTLVEGMQVDDFLTAKVEERRVVDITGDPDGTVHNGATG
jgi:hypothetical protein